MAFDDGIDGKDGVLKAQGQEKDAAQVVEALEELFTLQRAGLLQCTW